MTVTQHSPQPAKLSSTTTVRLSGAIRFQWESAQQCYVILYPEGMIQLNHSAGEILQRCQSPLRFDKLIQQLGEQFPAADNLVADVCEFLLEAQAKRWVCLD